MRKLVVSLLILIGSNCNAQPTQYANLCVFDTIPQAEKLVLYNKDASLCAAILLIDIFREELSQFDSLTIFQYKDITYGDIKNKLIFGLWNNSDRLTELWQTKYHKTLLEFDIKDSSFRNAKKLRDAFKDKNQLSGSEVMDILLSGENEEKVDLSYYRDNPNEMNENWMFYYTMFNADYEFIDFIQTDLIRKEIDRNYKCLNEFVLDNIDKQISSLYTLLLDMKVRNLKKNFDNSNNI